MDHYQYSNDHIRSDGDIPEPLIGRFRVELHRVITSEEALQRYIGYTPTMLPAFGRQHRVCIIPQTVTHSLVLLKMGKIISRNMLS